MDQPKRQSGLEINSPSKPSSKKLKLNGAETCSTSTSENLADTLPVPAGEPDTERTAPELQPPAWFVLFEKRFDAFEEKIDRVLSKRLGELNIKLNDQQEKIRSLEFDYDNVKKEVENLKEENSVLKSAVDDLENRSRRNNLVFYGLTEVGDAEDCRLTLNTMLQQHVKLPSSAYSIERVHRTPTFMQQRSGAQGNQQSQQAGGNAKKPRMIHVCFASYTQKQKVKTECLKHFTEEYNGHKLAVAEDLSKAVRNLRKNKMVEFKRLREEKKKPFFIYPAKLAYKDPNTGKLIFV